MTDSSYDVMVIGGGGAGMSAAIAASEAGASVCLLEASDRLGGATALAGGLLFVGGSDQQRERGIEDNADAMFNDVMAINPDAPAAAIRRLCNEAADSLRWLKKIGVNYSADRLTSPNNRTTPRAHEPEGFGMVLAEKLDHELHRHPVDIAMKSRVERLATDDSGRVIGAYINGELIHAKAVVIATGGIGGNPELVDRLLPKTKPISDWVWHTGWPSNKGDGVLMGEAIGAHIGGSDSALLLTSPGFFRDFEVIGPEWLPMVNKAGERFVAEDSAYWEIAEALEKQDGARGWAIFDATLLAERAKPHPRVLEALEIGAIKLSWVTSVLEEHVAKGVVKKADSLAELAKLVGIGPKLEASIAHYNDLAKAKVDSDFNKLPSNLWPLTTPPYYAAEIRPVILVVTGAGLCIDEHARVLGKNGQPIPGLYAAGETTGNIFGRNYVGSGYAITNSITYGRIAGREAAAS